jgi:hypothetical protein
MSSAAPVTALVSLQRFTLFARLPPEVRFAIWRFGLSPRIVEIIRSTTCSGSYSQAALPAALHACRESRQVVEPLYPRCFGSSLQPERVRFNFDLDTLYFNVSEEEEGLAHFLGILKEREIARLKYVPVDDEYLGRIADIYFTRRGLKRALRAMTSLREMVVVCDITAVSTSYLAVSYLHHPIRRR